MEKVEKSLPKEIGLNMRPAKDKVFSVGIFITQVRQMLPYAKEGTVLPELDTLLDTYVQLTDAVLASIPDLLVVENVPKDKIMVANSPEEIEGLLRKSEDELLSRLSGSKATVFPGDKDNVH